MTAQTKPNQDGAAAIPVPDHAAIRSHVELLHALAKGAGIEGILVLTRIEANNKPQTERFAIGDVDRMTDAIIDWATHPNLNIYVSYAVFRRDLPPGTPGGEADVRGVLALVGGLGSGIGKKDVRLDGLPLPPPYVLEISANNFQAVYPFGRALLPSDAKPIAVALSDAIGGDIGTKDVSHLWRIPGTLNWPTPRKLERGRPSIPQLVTIKSAWTGETVKPDDLREAVKGFAKTNSASSSAGAAQVALDLIARGIAPVPVPIGRKSPLLKEWQHLWITAADVPRYFKGHLNVGGLMGPASNDLADSDLDCKEAVDLAPFFLPRTGSVYGRPSKRRSHHLYTRDDPDPTAGIKLNDETGKCIVELRLGGGGKGAQSVMPGSLHGSGERYAWDDDGERATVTCAELKVATVKIAVGTRLIRHWPARGSRHDTALAVGGFLARAGWTGDDIEYFVTTICQVHGEADDPGAHGKTARDAAERHADGGQVYGMPQMISIFGEDVAKHIAKHLKYNARGEAPEPPAEANGLPTARFGPLSKMADRAEETLLAAKVPFYQRGQNLVRPVIVPAKTFHDKSTKTAQLVEVDLHYLRDAMCKAARWIKLDRRSRTWRDIHPPPEAALILLKRFGHWKFPSIAGIITTPTLRPDGTILAAPGYDPATGLLLVDPPPMPPIPDNPTRDDAIQSLAFLKGLLDEFPFIDSTARSVALSAQISTVCRGAYALVPMHVIDAPVAGSGKSYLLSTVSTIVTGQAMPVIGAGKSEEETEKRLGAAVIQGRQLVCLDNVTGDLGGQALCQLIEQPRPNCRVLGRSQLVEVEAGSVTYFANGNNIVIVGDLCRRVIRCRLDPRMERPEFRIFKGNPMRDILANRGAYIAAALTICRAYIAAGRPDPRPQLASFNEWSDTVRSALVWLGEADPVDSMDTSRADDPETSALLLMLTEWKSVFGTGAKNGKTLRYVIERCNTRSFGTNGDEYAHPGLRSAVLSIMPSHLRGQITLDALGYWMRSQKNRMANGMWFDKNSNSPATWWVESTSGGSAKVADETAAEETADEAPLF